MSPRAAIARALLLAVLALPVAPALAAGRTAHRHGGTPLALIHAGHAGSRKRERAAARAPLITAQPQSATVGAGQRASFAASASGTPAPTVAWQRSTNHGRSWAKIAGARSSVYSFTANAAENGYEYRAVFSNAAGSAASAAATLTVASAPATTPAPQPAPPAAPPAASPVAPAVTSNPVSTSVAAGTSASFSAAASGTPAPSVQWQVSTDAGASWSAIAGASAASYSFTADAGANGNEYRAAFTNAAGSATSAAATLTVTGAGGASAPAITANPADDTVPSGAGASFSAAASGTPAPGVQWQLSTDAGASWSAIAGATGTTYAFTASGAENGDRYRAVFSNGSGSATSAGATLTIAEQSTNWSGYYAWNGPFSAVTGTWTVPSVTCGSATTYSSQWIGIDGASDDTVEQDGTEADCSGGGAYYGAWYEMYGDSSVDGGYEVPLAGASHPVAAGDSMSASVSLSGATWTLEIADATEGWNYSVGIAQPSPAPQQASAEWIVERPEICSESCELANLSQFASVGFSAAAATTGSGAEPIGGLDESAIEMTSSDRSTVLAAPGPLSTGGSGFYDSWLASS